MMENNGSWNTIGRNNSYSGRLALRFLFFVMLMSLLLLNGCSFGKSTPVTEADTMLSRLQNYQHGSDEFSRLQLEAALRYFQGLDQQQYQWQSLFALANWHIANGNTSEALNYARQANALVEAPDSVLGHLESFQSSLQMGQLTNQSSYFEQAQGLAVSPLEQALVMAMVKDFDGLRSVLPNIKTHRSDQLAFLYYQLGKHDENPNYLESARSYYAQSGDSRGVTDSLFLQAKVLVSVNPEEARQIAHRALLAAASVPDSHREQGIRNWLQQHFATETGNSAADPLVDAESSSGTKP